MGKPGRPTKLTEEVTAKVVQLLSAGNYMSVAARGAGVDYQTVKVWLKRGKNSPRGSVKRPRNAFRDFFERVTEALTNAEVLQVARIVKAAEKDPKQARWWLTHGPPRKRWADNLAQGKIELTGKDGGPVRIEDARSNLERKLEQLAARRKPVAS